jgi:hypothetical protein
MSPPTSLQYPLSDSDIKYILEPDTKVQPYWVLDDMSHIDQVFILILTLIPLNLLITLA